MNYNPEGVYEVLMDHEKKGGKVGLDVARLLGNLKISQRTGTKRYK
jgi:hypothetical protein